MPQMVWYTVLAFQCCVGLLLAAPFDVGGEPEELPAELLQDQTSGRIPSGLNAEEWMSYLLQTHQNRYNNELRSVQTSYPQKRFADLGVPYLKYHYDKRNNGVWIWMPAQGYVSVPRKQQQGEAGDAKSGKIMRYGKRTYLL